MAGGCGRLQQGEHLSHVLTTLLGILSTLGKQRADVRKCPLGREPLETAWQSGEETGARSRAYVHLRNS